jgi:anti-anti-sigma regulatory factor
VKAGGQMKLVGITQNIQNLFTITRLVEIFDVYDTLDEAVMSFSNQEIIKQ